MSRPHRSLHTDASIVELAADFGLAMAMWADCFARADPDVHAIERAAHTAARNLLVVLLDREPSAHEVSLAANIVFARS